MSDTSNGNTVPWFASFVTGLGRHIGTAVATLLVSKGLLSAGGQEAFITTVAGLVLGAATVIWSTVQKRATAKRLAEAQTSRAPAAAAPAVPK